MHEDDLPDDYAEELDAGAEMVTLTCTTCGAVQTLPGFATIEMFVCGECGATVEPGGGTVQ